MKRKLLSLLFSLAMIFTLFSATESVAQADQSKTIKITGFTAPVDGEAANYLSADDLTLTIDGNEATFYSIQWKDTTDSNHYVTLADTDTFTAGTTYCLTLHLYVSDTFTDTSITGYKFSGFDGSTMHNGTVYSLNEGQYPVEINVWFIAGEKITSVENVTIPNKPTVKIGQKCSDYNDSLNTLRSSASSTPTDSAIVDMSELYKVDADFTIADAVSGGKTYFDAHVTACDTDDCFADGGRYVVYNDICTEYNCKFTDSTTFTAKDGTKVSGFYYTDTYGTYWYRTLELIEPKINNIYITFDRYVTPGTTPKLPKISKGYEFEGGMAAFYKDVNKDGNFDNDNCIYVADDSYRSLLKQAGYKFFDKYEAGYSYAIRGYIKNSNGEALTADTNVYINGEKLSYAEIYEGMYAIIPDDIVITAKTQISTKGLKLKTSSFVYNGKKKSVSLNYLPKSATMVSSGTYGTKVGTYTAVYSFTPEDSMKVAMDQPMHRFTWKIVPAASSVKSVTSGKNKLTIKATAKPASKGGTYYQIAYKQKGTSKWKYTTTKTSSKTIKSLKKGKTYYVKIRVYKKVSGKTYYGAWSKQKLSKKVK